METAGRCYGGHCGLAAGTSYGDVMGSLQAPTAGAGSGSEGLEGAVLVWGNVCRQGDKPQQLYIFISMKVLESFFGISAYVCSQTVHLS